MSFHIDHYTIHIPRGGKFTIGGVTTNKRQLLSLESKQSNIYHWTVWITIMARFTHSFIHFTFHWSYTDVELVTIGGVTTNKLKLLSLESKQSNIYHCTEWITIMAKFTNFWLLPCHISYTTAALRHIVLLPEWVPSFISRGAAHTKRRERPLLAKEGTIPGI